MLGVLILLAIAPSTPLLEKSAKRFVDFNACFAQAQDRAGRAWAFMPGGKGGTFTDSGASGGAATYWLQVRGVGLETRLRLFADAASPIAQFLEQCR